MAKASTPPSIHLRLLGASLLILPLFLGITALVLDRAFANYQMESQQESMRLQQLLLAKAADWDGSRWIISGLDELRFNLLRSGLYAFVLSSDDEVSWQSPSAELLAEPEDPAAGGPAAGGPAAANSAAAVRQMVLEAGLTQIEIGQSRFLECELGPLQFCYSTRVAWGSSGPESVFLIVESRDRVLEARTAYRTYLLWLSLATGTIGIPSR